MNDFLLELRCEEIPARMQAVARADLERLFLAEMDAAGVAPGAITVWSTPRRLALIARDLPEQTEAVSEETKGPPLGAPDQALDGFLRKVGLTRDQLQVRDLKGKDTYFAVVERPGRAVSQVLAEAIPAIVRAFPWPKSMRWGAASLSTESLRWVRPLSGIVAILGEDLVECEIEGIRSGYATKGHRFHHPDIITIGSAADYADKLRACHVIVDHEERQDVIRERARAAALAAGLTLVEDEGLVIENAGLTEWPVPLLGRFDEAFLDVPPEVIQLTARVNQKYFVCEDAQGKLANAFVCTANIEAADGGEAIVAGNRKVLAARLSDARFFWEQDQKKKLSEHAEGLKRITFHEKLGTVADKVERVARLAEWLASEGIVPGCDPKLARQAAELCKADLVTEMVGEFPELQGLMGGYYARTEGLPGEVADAIRDHYKPVGQGDEVPTAPVTVAVSLADKLDTLVGFFGVRERPTGSKDPFALRRAAIASIRIILRNELRMSLREAFLFGRALQIESASRFYAIVSFDEFDGTIQPVLPANRLMLAIGDVFAVPYELEPETFVHLADGAFPAFSFEYLDEKGFSSRQISSADDLVGNLFQYIGDRLEESQRESGVRLDLIRSVIPRDNTKLQFVFPALDEGDTPSITEFFMRLRNWKIPDDIVSLLARVHALQAFIGTEDGANLLAGYKRAANILKKEGYEAQGEAKPLSYTPEPAEKALIDSLAIAGPKAESAVAAEDFAGAMAALATLRRPIDAFFDSVTVNDPDADKRAARLALLDAFRVAVHNVADFSRIEG